METSNKFLRSGSHDSLPNPRNTPERQSLILYPYKLPRIMFACSCGDSSHILKHVMEFATSRTDTE